MEDVMWMLKEYRKREMCGDLFLDAVRKKNIKKKVSLVVELMALMK